MSTATLRRVPQTPLDVAWVAVERLILPRENPIIWALGVGLVVILNVGKLALPAVILCGGVGCYRAWRLRAVDLGPAGWWTARRAALLTFAGVDVLALMVFVGHPVVAALTGLVVLQLVGSTASPDKPQEPWSHERFATALVRARVVTQRGDDLPTVRYAGQPRPDERGTAVTFILPAGCTAKAVSDKHLEMASALGLAPRMLAFAHDVSDPANHVKAWFGTTTAGSVKVADRPSILDADSLVWSDPLLVDVDERGREVWLKTKGTHTAIVGATGSGKTVAGRFLALPWLLDPTATIYAAVGKDDIDDWRAMKPCCRRYVGGATAVSVRQVLEMLREVEDLSESREDAGRTAPGALLLVDEWYRIRLAGKRHGIDKDLDGLFGELLATIRSRNISVITLTQRGTETYLPTDQKANLMQRLVGMTADVAEVRYVLDRTLSVLPRQPGEFLVSDDDGEPTIVRFPHITDEMWREVCARAPKAHERLSDAPEPVTVDLTKPVTVEPSQPALDPLLEQVLRVLSTGLMTTTALHASLTPGLFPGKVGDLGKWLTRQPEFEKGGTASGSKGWRLSEAGRTVCDRLADGCTSAIHAQNPSGSVSVSVPSASAVVLS